MVGRPRKHLDEQLRITRLPRLPRYVQVAIFSATSSTKQLYHLVLTSQLQKKPIYENSRSSVRPKVGTYALTPGNSAANTSHDNSQQIYTNDAEHSQLLNGSQPFTPGSPTFSKSISPNSNSSLKRGQFDGSPQPAKKSRHNFDSTDQRLKTSQWRMPILSSIRLDNATHQMVAFRSPKPP